MRALALMKELAATGLTAARNGDQLLIQPASRLTPELRTRLLDAKPELLGFLREAERTTAELLTAAMRACDYWGDGPAEREVMRRECLEVPLHLRRDLLGHFDENYPPGRAPYRAGRKAGTDDR